MPVMFAGRVARELAASFELPRRVQELNDEVAQLKLQASSAAKEAAAANHPQQEDTKSLLKDWYVHRVGK